MRGARSHTTQGVRVRWRNKHSPRRWYRKHDSEPDGRKNAQPKAQMQASLFVPTRTPHAQQHHNWACEFWHVLNLRLRPLEGPCTRGDEPPLRA